MTKVKSRDKKCGRKFVERLKIKEFF